MNEAMRVHGNSRMTWCWNGKGYTAAGILVPNDVVFADNDRLSQGLPLQSDLEVLENLDVTLPNEVLPKGASLAPAPRRAGAGAVAVEPASDTPPAPNAAAAAAAAALATSGNGPSTITVGATSMPKPTSQEG
jgi:hypothetical protein